MLYPLKMHQNALGGRVPGPLKGVEGKGNEERDRGVKREKEERGLKGSTDDTPPAIPGPATAGSVRFIHYSLTTTRGPTCKKIYDHRTIRIILGLS